MSIFTNGTVILVTWIITMPAIIKLNCGISNSVKGDMVLVWLVIDGLYTIGCNYAIGANASVIWGIFICAFLTLVIIIRVYGRSVGREDLNLFGRNNIGEKDLYIKITTKHTDYNNGEYERKVRTYEFR